jgi:hypothetical protein
MHLKGICIPNPLRCLGNKPVFKSFFIDFIRLEPHSLLQICTTLLLDIPNFTVRYFKICKGHRRNSGMLWDYIRERQPARTAPPLGSILFSAIS